jgi:hypothetical protein
VDTSSSKWQLISRKFLQSEEAGARTLNPFFERLSLLCPRSMHGQTCVQVRGHMAKPASERKLRPSLGTLSKSPRP